MSEVGGHYYRRGAQQAAEGDPLYRSARGAADITGKAQCIHDHPFGVECNDRCVTLEPTESTGDEED